MVNWYRSCLQPNSDPGRSFPTYCQRNLSLATSLNECPFRLLLVIVPKHARGVYSFAFSPIVFSTASTPLFATSSSCDGMPVLHPTAPTTTPSFIMGMPPAIGVNLPPLLFQIPKAGPPGHTFSL